MNIGEWLKSKKFKTALVAVIVPFVTYFLDVPMEVAQTAVAGLITAILGFAHQDYAKARDGLSQAQLDVVGSALVKRLNKSGKLDDHTAGEIQGAIDDVKSGNYGELAASVGKKIIDKVADKQGD